MKSLKVMDRKNIKLKETTLVVLRKFIISLKTVNGNKI